MSKAKDAELTDKCDRFAARFREEQVEVKYTCVVAVLLTAVAATLIFLSIDAQGCPANTYSYDGQCLDCLANQQDCTGCSQFGSCDECAKGYYLGTLDLNRAKFSTCLPCNKFHGELCLECDAESCLKCRPGKSLFDGVCYDCESLYEGSITCDNSGARSCSKSYFLTRGDDGRQRCERCALHLDHCLECGGKDRCNKCIHDFFKLEGGKCSCRGGRHSFFNEAAKECQCSSGLVRTTNGC